MSTIEIHIIQNFPPSNLNRDDIGQPKSTDFGGVRRARISSQCQKRAIRMHPAFAKATGVAPSDRTGLVLRGLVRHILIELGVSEEQAITESQSKPLDVVLKPLSVEKSQVIKVATYLAEEYAKKPLDDGKTPTLIYFSEREMRMLAEHVCKDWQSLVTAIKEVTPAEKAVEEANKIAKSAKSKVTATNKKGTDDQKREAEQNFQVAEKAQKDAQAKLDSEKKKLKSIQDAVTELLKETKERVSAPDIALYGRMLADRPETNIDAACQVAHAISTHAVGKADTDYYTAMDDVKQRMKDPGAGFLDVAYFNSACFYRYMRIDFAQLQKTLGDHDMAVKTVEGFMRAAEAAVPSGKQNSHAHFVRPSFMLAVLRPAGSDGWNLANAFEKPVRANTEAGLIEQSVQKLQARFNHLREFYGKDAVSKIAVALPDGVVEPAQLSETRADEIKGMNEWVTTITTDLGKGA